MNVDTEAVSAEAHLRGTAQSAHCAKSSVYAIISLLSRWSAALLYEQAYNVREDLVLFVYMSSTAVCFTNCQAYVPYI